MLRQYPLLEAVGIGAVFQHLNIMICFDKRKVGIYRLFRHAFPQAAYIGHIEELMPLVDDSKAHRLLRIVRSSERLYIDISDVKILIRAEYAPIPLRYFLDYRLHYPPCPGICVDGDIIFAAHYTDASGMINMVMGHEYCGKALGPHFQLGERFRYCPACHACIYKHFHIPCDDER